MISTYRSRLLGVLQTRHAMRLADELLAAQWDDAPHVCPGCHAVGEEPCAPGCIDDEIQREESYARAEYDEERSDDDG